MIWKKLIDGPVGNIRVALFQAIEVGVIGNQCPHGEGMVVRVHGIYVEHLWKAPDAQKAVSILLRFMREKVNMEFSESEAWPGTLKTERPSRQQDLQPRIKADKFTYRIQPANRIPGHVEG